MKTINKLIQRIKKSKLVQDSFWAVFGNIIGKGLSLVAAILIGRFLGKEIYGEYGILTGTIGSIAIFSNFGLNFTATKYIAQHKETEPEILPKLIKTLHNSTLIIGLIAAFILFLTAQYFSNYILEAPNLQSLLQLVSIGIAFTSINRTQVGILAGLGRFKELSKINTIIGILNFGIGVSATYFYGIIGALVTVVFNGLINYFLHLYYIKKYEKLVKIRTKNNISVGELFRFSLPVAIQEALYSLLTYSYGLLLVKYSTYGEVGLNAAAVYWSALILFIPGILRNVILSHLSSSLEDGKKRLRILRIVLLFNFVVTAIISMIIFAFSSVITGAYGGNFIGLKDVLNISVFTTIFISLSNVYAQAYMSEDKNWLMLFFRLIRDLLILVIAYYFIRQNQGVQGALSLAKSVLWSNIFFLILMAGVYEYNLRK